MEAAVEKFIHRYPPDAMPIPPVPEHTEMFDAGDLSIGVEFRVLNDEVVGAAQIGAKLTQQFAPVDAGVSLHVYMQDSDGRQERLRFDCFDEEPHYHYINWPKGFNDAVFIDPAVIGDPLRWALDCLLNRLPPMMEKAGVANAASRLDARRIEAILPLVAEAAYRARFHADKGHIEQGAVADGQRRRA